MRWPGRDVTRRIRRATLWASLCAVLSAAGLAFALVSAERAYRARAALLALEAQPLCRPDAPPGTAAGAQCRPITGATVAATRFSRGRSGRRLLDLFLDGGRRVSVTVSDHDGLYDRLAHGERVIAVLDGENVSEVRTLDAGGAPGGRILTRGSPHQEVADHASAVLLGLLAAGFFGLPIRPPGGAPFSAPPGAGPKAMPASSPCRTSRGPRGAGRSSARSSPRWGWERPSVWGTCLSQTPTAPASPARW